MRKPLWRHQQYALDKYKDRKFFGLLFPCGTGKSITAIAIAEEKEKPVLIIAPNVLCRQWEENLQDKTQCNKEWKTVVCTSKTKNTKKFKKAFEHLLDNTEEMF